jgi:preprotein translocase SecE subunit
VTRIRRFIAEAVSELKKVSWPTFEQTRQLTVLVFGVSLAVGIYVFVFDRIFQGIIGLLTKAIG